MKICIDVRCLVEGRHTGVEEYTLGLLESLFNLDKKNEYILFLNSWKKPGFDFSVFSKFSNVKIKRLKFPNKLLNFSFWYFNWPKIDRLVDDADIVFLPNIIFNATSKKARLIATIHDLSFECNSEYFSAKKRWWHIFVNPRKICRKAERIIAVSDSTKNDLVDLYGIKKEKIEMISSGAREKFRVIDRNHGKMIAVKEKYSLPYKFILFLGTIEPRKNIAGLIKAFNAFQKYAGEKNSAKDLLKYKLVIAGEKGWKSEKIFWEIENSPFRKNIRLVNFISDEDKEYLYNLASLFVYPSFFEGFGFPPLEAMKCGVPVITGNNSSLPEIVGSAGILIDPDKPDEIYRAIREILLSKELKDNLVRKGLEKAKEFSWKKTAEKTIELLTSTNLQDT